MGRLTLPSTVFLDEKLRVLQPISGYKDPETFEMIMTYYGDGHYKSTPYTLYQKSYVKFLSKKHPLLSSCLSFLKLYFQLGDKTAKQKYYPIIYFHYN